jgi:glucokinase
MNPLIAVDIGGSLIRAGLFSQNGKILCRVEKPNPARQSANTIIKSILAVVESVWPTSGRVQAIGISAPGPLDPVRGVILHSPNIPGWDNYPLVEELEKYFHVTVRLNDDANLAALAEHRLGAGKGCNHLVYLTISTGVGSGIIVDNKLLIGSAGIGAEAGHMLIQESSPLRCGCGNYGCLESLISGPSLAEQARLALSQSQDSLMWQLSEGDPKSITAKTVAEAARQGDALAIEIFDQAGKNLGIALTNLLYIFNPQMVVIGGSVSKAGELLLDPARQMVRKICMSYYWINTPIVLAELGDDTSLWGAYYLALDIHF